SSASRAKMAARTSPRLALGPRPHGPPPHWPPHWPPQPPGPPKGPNPGGNWPSGRPKPLPCHLDQAVFSAPISSAKRVHPSCPHEAPIACAALMFSLPSETSLRYLKDISLVVGVKTCWLGRHLSGTTWRDIAFWLCH